MAPEEKAWKALYFAALRDATDFIELVPGIGEVVSDIIEDTAIRSIEATLTREELREYLKKSQFIPEVPAMAMTLNISPTEIEKAAEKKGWIPLPPSPLRILKEKGWPIP